MGRRGELQCLLPPPLHLQVACPCVLSHFSLSNSSRLYGLHPTRFLCPWDFPGSNTGVGYHALLQGIVPTQGSNLSLLCSLPWQVGSLPR